MNGYSYMSERIIHILTSGAQTIMAAFVLFLPIIFVPVPWATIPHVKMLAVVVFTAVALTIWAVARIWERRMTLPMSGILAVGILLPIAYAVSAIVSGGSVGSFVGTGVERDTVAAMILWLASMAGAAAIFSSGRLVVSAYRALLVALGIVGLFQIGRLLLGPDILFGNVLIGPAASIVGSWHDLGILLGFSVVLVAAVLGSLTNRGIWRFIAYAVLAISLSLLVIVNLRDVWIALAAIAALSSGYLWWANKRAVPQRESIGAAPLQESTSPSGGRFSLVLFICIFAIAVLGVFFGSYAYNILPERLQIPSIEVRPSWQGTASIGASVYQDRNALFGSGPNTFVREWGFYKPSGVNETAFWNADFTQGVGFIPTAAVTVGIFGAFAWGAFLLMFLISGIRSLIRIRADVYWRMPLFALFSGVTYLWVMHIVYPPGGALLALSFLLTGVFIAAQRSAGTISTHTFSAVAGMRTWIPTAVALVLIVGSVLVASTAIVRAIASDMFVNRSITTYNTTENYEQSQSYLRTALSLNPGYDRALRAVVELNLLRFVKLAEQGGQTQEAQEALRASLEAAIQGGLEAVSSNEGNYQNWLTLARVYEQLAGVQVAGAYENAQTAYEQAIEKNPTNPTPYFQLARLAIAQGDVEGARTYITRTLEKKKNHAAAYILLSQIEYSAGNTQEAIQAAQNAASSAPSEPTVWFQFGALLYVDGQNEFAAQALERAVILNSNYANALYVLALTYEQLGRNDDAVTLLEHVALLNPDNTFVRETIERIETGEPADSVTADTADTADTE